MAVCRQQRSPTLRKFYAAISRAATHFESPALPLSYEPDGSFLPDWPIDHKPVSPNQTADM
jgi:hypothetical protein